MLSGGGDMRSDPQDVLEVRLETFGVTTVTASSRED